jgi:hypothetical protein
MDISNLNKALIDILEKRIELSKLKYSDETYDEVEEELHDLEDDFTEQHGEYLEKEIEKVHKKYCSESDVLLAVSYLPKVVTKSGEIYKFKSNEGVLVEMDDPKIEEARLILLPSPVRILLLNNDKLTEVWKAV